MIFKGTLLRLAAWYLALLALIIVCFNLIVYFTLSQTLHARVSSDLRAKAAIVSRGITVSGETVTANLQLVSDPRYADTFVFVLQFGERPIVVVNAPKVEGLFPADTQGQVSQVRAGQASQTEVVNDGQPFAVYTQPIFKDHKTLVGFFQVARPISWIAETLNRLVRQLALASGVAMLLGVAVAFLMAQKSLRPIANAFQKQREFVADASHELRTPLTLIRANAEAWLRRGQGPGSVYAHQILDEVDQLNSIVGDLTTLALADSRQLRVDRRPMELTGVVRELMEHTEPLAEERGVTMKPELNGGVSVQGDPVRIRQLLLILLDNALTYTPSGGEVFVGVGRVNGKARITINDTGVGIPEKDLPHIFDRFYRADKARNSENGGSGLGLAIAKWIVEAHKGFIEVRSVPGEGTQVSVSLPALH
jgi:signal transduction histidine kinase